MEELLYLGGAVQVGGLVEGAGDILDAGEQQHRVIADSAPDGHDGAGDEHDLGVGEPTDVFAQQRVEDAVLGVEDPLPHHSHGGGGHHHGQEVDGTEGGLALDLGVEQHRHQQRQEHADGHRQDAEVDGVPGRFPEFGAFEHFHVVFQPAELVRAEGLGLGKAHVDGLEEGNDV